MTRFARAKGSKSSNEKTPEDGTPWEVMKQQLLNAKKESEEAKHREEIEKQRIENYQNFLKDQKTQKKKATWCDFPEDNTHKKVSNNQNYKSQQKKQSFENNDRKDIVSVSKQTSDKTKNFENSQKRPNITSDDNVPNSEEGPSPKRKNKNKKKSKQVDSNDNNDIEPPTEINVQANISKKAKKKKKNKKTTPTEESSTQITTESAPNNDGHNSDIVPKEDSSYVNNKNRKKNKKQKVNNESGTEDTRVTTQVNQEASNNNTQPKKPKKFIDKNKTKPNRRKPIPDNSFQLIINGKDVDLVRYDGFPIMKKDAERLDELRQNMMRRGIPKSEVQRNMKLERRRAEKALARLKRDVCYNCRKGGHNLSDCPELKSKIPGLEAPDGICFKCGSTEHRQFECKVQRDKEFRFASCFICKESGHIARQCPDNPKGLYPNGGCCKLCGDVTHLRKDCPTVNEQKEATSIKLPTLVSEENIEDIASKANPAPAPESQLKKPKKITF